MTSVASAAPTVPVAPPRRSGAAVTSKSPLTFGIAQRVQAINAAQAIESRRMHRNTIVILIVTVVISFVLAIGVAAIGIVAQYSDFLTDPKIGVWMGFKLAIGRTYKINFFKNPNTPNDVINYYYGLLQAGEPQNVGTCVYAIVDSTGASCPSACTLFNYLENNVEASMDAGATSCGGSTKSGYMGYLECTASSPNCAGGGNTCDEVCDPAAPKTSGAMTFLNIMTTYVLPVLMQVGPLLLMM